MVEQTNFKDNWNEYIRSFEMQQNRHSIDYDKESDSKDKLSPYAKLLALVLGTYCKGESNECWPNVNAHLIGESGLLAPAYKHGIKELKEKGIVKVTKNQRVAVRDDGIIPMNSYVYKLILKKPKKKKIKEGT